jgi:prepilin-type N-terminal cleavage/methylation domain-containing protein
MAPSRTTLVRASRAGYTLIELLVVIGILAILASLTGVALFKVLGKAQATADQVNWRSERLQGMTVRRTTPINVLFLGNSYTMANNLPQLISDLAAGAGNNPALTYDTHLVGGATLESLWNDGTSIAKIRQGGWDFVVLQEQSMRPIEDEGDMDVYARLFCAEIRAVNAIPLFFMTWARQYAPATQPLLTNAYLRITKEQHAEVAPVGMAWQSSLQQYPQLTLHASDGSHPNPTGSYLAACVFYASLYDKSPQGLPSSLDTGEGTTVTLAPSDAAFLQGVAWQTVQQVKKKLIPGWQPAA